MAIDKTEKRPNQPGQGGGKNQAIDPKNNPANKKNDHGSGIPKVIGDQTPPDVKE